MSFLVTKDLWHCNKLNAEANKDSSFLYIKPEIQEIGKNGKKKKSIPIFSLNILALKLLPIFFSSKNVLVTLICTSLLLLLSNELIKFKNFSQY